MKQQILINGVKNEQASKQANKQINKQTTTTKQIKY